MEYHLFAVCILLFVAVASSFAYTVEKMTIRDQFDDRQNVKELDFHWQRYMKNFNKTYNGLTEANLRRMIWEENVKKILKHNKEADFGLHSYHMGINKFTDMTYSEFSKRFLSSYVPNKKRNMARLSNMTVPESVDWRLNEAVTPIKDQGDCGSCWSFAATGALEGQLKLNNYEMVSLSEQNLVDCSREYGNLGCNGGDATFAFQYIQENGIDSEECYPYEATDGTCRFMESCVQTYVSEYQTVPPGEDNLEQFTANVGPIAVAVAVSERFKSYSYGIFDDQDCNNLEISHAVLAVGYTPEYWIIKNSWGTYWGMEGYMQLAKNKGDVCKVSQDASYAYILTQSEAKRFSKK